MAGSEHAEASALRSLIREQLVMEQARVNEQLEQVRQRLANVKRSQADVARYVLLAAFIWGAACHLDSLPGPTLSCCNYAAVCRTTSLLEQPKPSSSAANGVKR